MQNKFIKSILRILVVEDSEDDALFNLNQIKKGGYDIYYERVETAETFITAINSKSWDIIFSDFKMPRFSGLKALILLKESGKDIPFIIISGVIGEEVAVEAMKSGAHDYIMKNNLNRLLPAVERELHESEERVKKRVLEQKQKQVDETLKASEERFRTLYENVKIGLYRTTPDGTILMANKTLVSMLGFSSFGELAKRKLAQEGFELHQQRKVFLETIEQNGEIENFESTWIRQDGTIVFVRESARAIRDSNGDTLYYDGSVEDITKRKQAEEALRESEARYLLLFEKSADGILIADIETKTFKYANPALCRMLGYTEKELKTMGITDIHPKQNWQHIIAEFEAIAHEEKVLSPDIPCLRKDGSIVYADIKSTTIIIDGKSCNMGLFRDITERKLAEEEKEKLTMQLKELVKEIRCLYLVASIIEIPNIEIGEMFTKIVDVIPSGWQYPDMTCARITINKDQYKTHNYKETKWRQASDITVNGTKTGCIEVFYLEEKAEIDEDPFLEYERGLIIFIAERLGDTIERKRAEEALRESKNVIQHIIDNSPSLIYILDLDGKFILANRKLAEVLNSPAEKLLGNTRQSFMAKEFADQHRNNDLQVITTKQSYVYEEEILESDRRHIYLTQKFPLFNSEGKIYAVGGISTDITARKRMEEVLRYERSLLRLLIDNVPDLMYTKDTACRKTLVNKADVQNMGVKFESEVIGKDDFAFFTKEMAEKFYADDLSVIQTGQPLINKEEYTINDKGQEKWLLTSKFPLRDESGQIIGLAGIGRDITERKRTEAALLDSERRYRLLVETVNEGILVAQNGYLKFVNPMMQVITGFTHEELLALPFIDYVHPEDREIVMNNHMKRLKGEQFLPRYQFRIVKKDGSSRRIEMNGIVIEWEGQPATLNMLTDITERKQAEEALQHEHTLLRLLIDNVPDLIYAKDTDCRKTLANNADVRHTGAKSEAEVLGKDDFAFHPKEIAEKFYADDLSVIQTGQPLLNREEYTIDQEGQKKWLLTSKFPLRDVKGQIIGLVGITRDITQRKQVEEKIKLKNEQLQTLNAEKDKFFSIVAHDLRSPLGSFIGIAELLVAELPNLAMDKIQWYALKMRDSATKLFRFLDNLLEWAKMQRGLIPFEPGLFQLSPVIDECLVTLKEPAQKKRIEITTDIPHQLEVVADRNMFNSVIRNLVSNAIKFTPQEGKISISARETDEKSIEIAIKDTGIGMDSKMVDNLFQIDAQTNRIGTEGEPSSGLGLILCKEFIKKHNGNIRVESEEKNLSLGKDGGTTFYFTIPRKEFKVTTEI